MSDKDLSTGHEQFARLIDKVLSDIAAMLKEKNKKYGNSAMKPLRVFSDASPIEQIKVRIDDKLSRLVRGVGIDEDEDVLKDLIGYLVILYAAKEEGKGTI
jgi:hypothetical protein